MKYVDRRFSKMSLTKRIVTGIAIISVPLISAIILYIPPERLTENAASLISALVWPYLTLILITLFWTQLDKLFFFVLENFRKRSISEVIFGNIFGIKLEVEKIPAPKNIENTTLSNIALLHTSFLTSKRPIGYDEATTFYQFEVIVAAPTPVMDSISHVKYYLGEPWPESLRERTIENRSSRFKMKDLANGTSIVRADVYLRDKDEPIQLNRFIDLRPNGPEI
jgi:hypothetical protein